MLRAIELAETINALTCQINLLRDDEALKGKQGRLRAPAQVQTDRQTGGLSVREVVQSNAPRRSTDSLTCQKKIPRDDAAGMARGNDDRGRGGWCRSGRGDGDGGMWCVHPLHSPGQIDSVPTVV